MKNFLITLCITMASVTSITLYPAQTQMVRLLPMHLPPAVARVATASVATPPLTTSSINALKLKRQPILQLLPSSTPLEAVSSINTPKTRRPPTLQLLPLSPSASPRTEGPVFYLPNNLFDDISDADRERHKIRHPSGTKAWATGIEGELLKIEHEKQERIKLLASLAALSARIRNPSIQPTSPTAQPPEPGFPFDWQAFKFKTEKPVTILSIPLSQPAPAFSAPPLLHLDPRSLHHFDPRLPHYVKSGSPRHYYHNPPSYHPRMVTWWGHLVTDPRYAQMLWHRA